MRTNYFTSAEIPKLNNEKNSNSDRKPAGAYRPRFHVARWSGTNLQLLVANPENMAHQGAALSYNSRWSAYMREMVHSERSAALRFADVPPRRPRFGFGHAVPVLAPLPVAAAAPVMPSPRRRPAPLPGTSQREASLTLPPIATAETTTARDFSPPIRGMACFMSGRRHGRRVCDEFRNGRRDLPRRGGAGWA